VFIKEGVTPNTFHCKLRFFLNITWSRPYRVVSLRKLLFQISGESLGKSYLILQVSLANRSASHPGGSSNTSIVDSCFWANFTVTDSLQ